MKNHIAALSLLLLSTATVAVAQEKASPLEISGSVDTYYKYDFNKSGNIKTFFASDQNSVSLGMIDLALKKTTGKASFVGELSFGPRGQEQSLLTAADGNSFHIQNLYVDYAFSDKFNMTAGFMGTFIGYEVISPAANFNYSTSYLFGAGPFQNAGVKGTYSFSDKVSLMLGLFNEWNVYSASRGTSSIGGQLMVSPVEGWTAYINGLHGLDGYGNYSTIFDLTTAYEINDKVKIGLNAADLSAGDDSFGYSGVALYPQYAFTPAVALGLRAEYFNYKGISGGPSASVTSFTLSGNIKSGGLTFIPEVRFDNDKDFTQGFLKSNLTTFNKSAAQFSLAAVYSF
ncbi:MAG: outer membrane beta-barrel protein [Pedobacter sp.]|uniref:outer membrane beta-barrel protein n=1 Tax=Pedobacter sp. TaxID=1411316 RepID=UPI00280A3647|nr:outer membrane beta-barrel protein [Pedobacter sp.]MDQ8004009.1 outer membrane beta-barrel protein [Pedobacter sp.]